MIKNLITLIRKWFAVDLLNDLKYIYINKKLIFSVPVITAGVFAVIIFIFLILGIMPLFNSPYKYETKYNKYIVEFSEQEIQEVKKQAGENPHCMYYFIEQKGSFWRMAAEYDLDVDTILGCNPYLKSIYAPLNEELIVPDTIGVIHYVRKGENLRSISKLYSISISVIKKFNRLEWWRFKRVTEGKVLFIPYAKPIVMTESMAEFYNKRIFLSPIPGIYTSGFGMRINPIYRNRQFHRGRDLAAPIGTAVGAAMGGLVIYAGWMGGYGNYIKIAHANGYITGYGHLSKINVRTGQKVKAGWIIGKSGNTGQSTGPHLDFTICKSNKWVNPDLYIW